ncbi:MAG: two-component regulator propeller domain-containing protein [Bacteroidota bacterium]|nr:two-component regulator propeller domain-containing protein [Bacteroidota bacterium]
MSILKNRVYTPLRWLGTMLQSVQLASCMLILLSLSSLTPSYSQVQPLSEYTHQAWSVEQGFTQYMITAIARTRDGYLWLGTGDGLVRFDGVQFTLFDHRNTPAIKSNYIKALCEDENGTLWIGCYNGGILHHRDQNFSLAGIPDGIQQTKIFSMHYSAEDDLWVGTDSGLFAMSIPSANRFTDIIIDQPRRYPPLDQEIKAISEGPEGTIYAVESSSKIMKKSLRERTFTTVCEKVEEIFSIFVSRNNKVWIGSNKGLFVLQDSGLTRYKAANGFLRSWVETFYEDREGNLWIGTIGDGLWKLENNIFKRFSRAEGLSSDRVSSLFEDDEGNLWIGTRGGGLNRLRKKAVTTYSKEDGLLDDHVSSVIEDRSGVMWIGTKKGLNSLRLTQHGPEIGSYLLSPVERENIVRSVVEESHGRLWVATEEMVWRLSGKTFIPALRAQRMRTLLFDSDNNLWIGGTNQGGLVQLNANGITYLIEKSGTVDRVDSLPDRAGHLEFIKAIIIDKDGTFWLGTNGGLVRIQSRRDARLPSVGQGFPRDSVVLFNENQGLIGNAVLTLHYDEQGVLWISVYGYGLYRLNPEHAVHRFSRISKDDGLFDNTLYSILEDDQGRMWFGSNLGIFSIRKQELHDFCDVKISEVHPVVYGIAEGMKSLECNGGNQPSAWKSRDGRLWFPTVEGVVVIDPNRPHTAAPAPRVYFEQLIADDSSYTVQSNLTLPAGTRKLTFAYTGISFTSPTMVRFKYKIDVIDHDWHSAGFQRNISYVNIPPGTYTIRVIAANNEGLWNTEGAAISFTILPHLWERTWVQLLAGVVLLAAFTVSVRKIALSKQRRRMQALQQEYALERERSRISRDMHDEVGASLTKLMVMSEFLRERRNDQSMVKQYAAQISKESREVIQKLDEIIWFINPKHNTLESLLAHLRRYLGEYFAAADIRIRFDFPLDVPPTPISATLRQNVYLVLKEAANNVIKYASASEVYAAAHLQEDSITIIFSDNGNGFSVEDAYKLGRGITNMRKRIEDVGGTLLIVSQQNTGTRIEVSVTLQ